MQLTPYLNFKGQCAEAFRFYEKVLGGKIEFIQTNGESPMGDTTPPSLRDQIVHACMKVGDGLLMASDAPPEQYVPPQGNFVLISVPSVQEGQRVFTALSENGKVSMPFGQTFWSPGFGMLTDRFGTPWMVNTIAAST